LGVLGLLRGFEAFGEKWLAESMLDLRRGLLAQEKL
jgi:hypothetical protein